MLIGDPLFTLSLDAVILGQPEVQACNMWVRGALWVMAVGNGEVSRGSQVHASCRLMVV